MRMIIAYGTSSNIMHAVSFNDQFAFEIETREVDENTFNLSAKLHLDVSAKQYIPNKDKQFQMKCYTLIQNYDFPCLTQDWQNNVCFPDKNFSYRNEFISVAAKISSISKTTLNASA